MRSPVIRRMLVGIALSAIGNGLTLPLLVIYLGQVRGLGTAVAGFVVAYTAVISLVLTPAAGTLVDRFGPRPILMLGLVMEAIGVACLTLITSVPSAFLVATLVAFGGSFVWGPQSALLGRYTAAEDRQRVFGIQFMLLNLGIGIGGIIAATIVHRESPESFTRLYLIDALTFFLYVIVVASLRGIGVGPILDEEGERAPTGGFREVLGDRRLLRFLAIGLLLITAGYGSVEVAVPVFITIINGLSVTWVAISYTVNTATIVVLQLFSLRFINGRSRSRLLAGVAVLWAVSWLLVGVSGLMPMAVAAGLICTSTFVFAVGETLWAPVAPALVNDLAPEHLRGRYNSAGSLVWGVAGTLGPAIAGILLGHELVVPWLVFIVVSCGAGFAIAWRMRAHLTPALDGREPAPAAGGTMPA